MQPGAVALESYRFRQGATLENMEVLCQPSLSDGLTRRKSFCLSNNAKKTICTDRWIHRNKTHELLDKHAQNNAIQAWGTREAGTLTSERWDLIPLQEERRHKQHSNLPELQRQSWTSGQLIEAGAHGTVQKKRETQTEHVLWLCKGPPLRNATYFMYVE